MDYSKNIRVFSLLGQRGTFGKVLKDLAAEDERIVALSADLTRTSGLEQFASTYPDRMYNVGIAEENAVGMAAGLADQGFVPFVTTFANFATLRANEFVRHFMAYMRCNVKIVGLGSGFAMEFFGNTHYGLEDVAVLRSMPNLSIFSPADGLEVAKCVEFATKTEGPMYIRLSGKMNNPIVHKNDFDFVSGQMLQLRQGCDVVLFSTGSMVYTSLRVAEELEKKDIHASVFDVHTIKPFDEKTVIQKKDAPLLVTIEEHCNIGGLGSAVSETISSQARHGKLIRIGTGDRYEKAGNYDYMLQVHGLTPEAITNKILNELRGEEK